jgi:hypothetical protein
MVQMEPELLKNLMNEVKETIATDLTIPKKPKQFGMVDMWNIRRNSISARERFKG